MTRLSSTIALALATGFTLSASPAAAQQYVHSTQPRAWTPIQNIPGITGLTTTAFPSADDNAVSNLPIGFDFNFMGAVRTVFGVSTNGFVQFDMPASSSLSNQVPGDAAAPNNWIAAVWDDLVVSNAGTALQHGVVGTAPNRIRVIQVSEFGRFSSSNGGAWQVWLYEGPSGRFDVQVNGTPANASSFSFTMGYEGPNGTPSRDFLGCGATCGAAQYASAVGNVYSTFISNVPELTGELTAGTWPRGAFPGAGASGQFTVRNLGAAPASNVLVHVHLSTDDQLDASDRLLGNATVATVPAGNQPATGTVNVTVPADVPAGDYRLILQVDPLNAFPEAVETDNVVPSSFMFATAYDVSASALTAPNGATSGNPITFNVTIVNNGVPFAGALAAEVWASLDQSFDALSDVRIGQTNVMLTGQNTESANLVLTLPTLPVGLYHPVVVLDPMNTVVELNENNNTFVSPTRFPTGPDFSITQVTVPNLIQGNGTVDISTQIASSAVPYTGNVEYRLVASTDAVLDANDTVIGTYTVSFTGQPSVTDARNVTFPAQLPANAYRIIAVVDPNSAIAETNETNNSAVSTNFTTNAPDFRMQVSTVDPLVAQVGDQLTVTGTFLSSGVLYTGAVGYRIYLSPDDQFDAADTPLADGAVNLAGEASVPFSLTFPLPSGTPVGRFALIAVADPQNAVPEAIETNNWGASTQRLDVTGPDLRIERVTTDEFAFLGRPFTVTLTIENDSNLPASMFEFSVHLSDNDVCNINRDPAMADAVTGQPYFSVPGLAGRAIQDFTVDVVIPANTSTTTAWICGFVDVFSRISETNEGNNVRRRPDPITIRFPVPDLTGAIFEASSAGAPGESIAVTRLLSNVGVADAPSFEYAYYLSSNPTISSDDILIERRTGSLLEGEDDFAVELTRLPSGVVPGTYYLGLILNPEGTLEESTRANNAVVGPQLQVYEPTIRFTTDRLPNGVLGVNYEVGIYAVGGPLGLQWALESGSLPPGLGLDGPSGILSGVPTQEGVYEFSVRASSGTAFAIRSFQLRVIAPTITLAVATESIPTAVAGRAYQVDLIAVGGVPPYEWSLFGARPGGIQLDSNGRLSGTPGSPGNYPLSVSVRDDLGTTASRTLALNVIGANQGVVITQLALPAGTVDLPYCGEGDAQPVALNATGGLGPYSWSILGTGAPGMRLEADGRLCGRPEVVGFFPLLVRAQDQTGLFDTSLFILEVTNGTQLLITTPSLPDGEVGVDYATEQLNAIRGEPPYTWSVLQGELPPGLSLNSGGILSGTPTEGGLYAFTVVVEDARLRTDVQPLSVYVVPAPPSNGGGDGCDCRTVGGEPPASPWLGLAAFAFLAFGRAGWRRRRWLAGLALGGGLALSPGAASAQTYFHSDQASPWVPIASIPGIGNLSNVQWSGTDESVVSGLPIGFGFVFASGTYTTFAVSTNGFISFDPQTSAGLTNQAPGTPSTPNNLIAAVWDDLAVSSASGAGRYGTVGSAPNRILVIEVSQFGRWSSSTGGEWQIWLYEGPQGRFDVRVNGMPANSGSLSFTMGYEGPNGAPFHDFLGCGANCSAANYTSAVGRVYTAFQDPGVDLVASRVSAPLFGSLGAPTPVQVMLANLHRNPVGPFRFQVVFSPTARLDPATWSVGYTSGLQNFAPFQQQSTTVSATPNAALPVGAYYVGLVVDSEGAVTEVNEENNRLVAEDRIILRNAAPDLTPIQVTANRASASAGDTLVVTTRIRNIGALPAAGAQVAVVLSTNPAISPEDAELGRASLGSVAAQTTVTATLSVVIPTALNTGTYYVGALADPDNTIVELSEANNGLAVVDPIRIQGGALAVLTARLPSAQVGAAYAARLQASGGNGAYAWALDQGVLPTGLGVTPQGELFGRAGSAQCETVVFRVTDGTSTARSGPLQLCAVAPNTPLTIVTRQVPVAVAGQEFSHDLIAIGGAATSTAGYTWSGTGLPEGLTVSARGALAGTPVTVGSQVATVRVSDGTSEATREITIEVAANARLQIDPVVLPTAVYGASYDYTLTAAGGLPPVSWTLDSGNLPAGIMLGLDGRLFGTPAQAGRFRFVVEARDAGSGSSAARDRNSFELVVQADAGFRITTAALPPAVVGVDFSTVIETEGGEAPILWAVVEGRIPDGFSDETAPERGTLRIFGTPTREGRVSLLLSATDGAGRRVFGTFVLDILAVAPPAVCDPATEDCPVTDDDGCSCRSAPKADERLAWLGMLGLLLLLGARTGRRRAPS